MAASTFHFTTAVERREHVAAAYLKGMGQHQIAHEVGVTQQQISLDLKAMREQWMASALRNFDEAKSLELAKVDQIELAAWQGWERSLLPREVTITEGTEGGNSSRRKATVRRENQIGDPRFLERVQKCIDQRADILGLKAASRHEHTGKDGEPMAINVNVKLTLTEALARVYNLQSERAVRTGSSPDRRSLPPGS